MRVCVCVRQAKLELRTATAKVDEMTKLMMNFQDQMQRTVCVSQVFIIWVGLGNIFTCVCVCVGGGRSRGSWERGSI